MCMCAHTHTRAHLQGVSELWLSLPWSCYMVTWMATSSHHALFCVMPVGSVARRSMDESNISKPTPLVFFPTPSLPLSLISIAVWHKQIASTLCPNNAGYTLGCMHVWLCDRETDRGMVTLQRYSQNYNAMASSLRQDYRVRHEKRQEQKSSVCVRERDPSLCPYCWYYELSNNETLRFMSKNVKWNAKG